MRTAILLLALSLLPLTHATAAIRPEDAQKTTNFSMYAGSLKANITRLAKQNGWSNVVWNSDHDYSWVGNTRIPAQNLPGVLQKVLANYPLQATFYEGNHILVLAPRKR